MITSKELQDKFVGKIVYVDLYESYNLCLGFTKEDSFYITLKLLTKTGEIFTFILIKNLDYINNNKLYNLNNRILIELIK